MTELFHNFWFLVFGWLALTSVAATLAQAWQKMRRADREAALKLEMLRRGLSVEEMERLLPAGSKAAVASAPEPSDDDVEKLASTLARWGARVAVIEETFTAIRNAEPDARQRTCRAVEAAIINNGSGKDYQDQLILAVVRGLCPPADAAASAPVPEPVTSSKATNAFQISKPA